MARLSQLFLPTLREDPADAEALSHRLMVRAGLIRQLGSGLWTWLPAGYRVVNQVEAIVREEIDAIGGQEMLMPVLQPAELWRKTGRYGIEELFKLEDRKGTPHVLAMTHEEALTFHVARELRSYRELPKILYHLQVKERDEPRPRAGVLRTREFTMKDSYSFDRDSRGSTRATSFTARAYAPDPRPLRATLVRGRGRRRDDGRLRRARVHGAVRGGRERGRAGARLRRQRRGRLGEPKPMELPPPLDEPREVPTPGPDDGRRGRRMPSGCPPGRR